MQKNDVYYVREQTVIFTGYNQTKIQHLGHESRNCTVLDTACTSTVCGTDGCNVIQMLYLKSNLEKSKSFLRRTYSNLEEESALNQLNVYCLHEIIISVDVVHLDIPMLLSLESLKKASVKLDVENDEAEILGTRVSPNFTSSGQLLYTSGSSRGH